MNKRTTVYLQSPLTYDMSGCACGNNDPEWSEYQKHLWCSKCKIDFIPKHRVIFDSPVGLNACKILGIHFSRLVLATNKIEVLNSDGNYVECLNAKEVIASGKIQVKISEHEYGIIDYKKNALECNSEAINLTTEIIFDYPAQEKFILTWNKLDEQFIVENNPELKRFHQYLLKNTLELNLPECSVKEKKAKI